MTAPQDERAEAHAELARERWQAHREQHESEKELAEAHWEAHRQQHDSIARNLAEYKAQSNEWRGSLSDLRATFASQATLDSIEAQMRAGMESLNTRIDTEREERRDQQNLRTGSVDTWKWIAGFLGFGGVGAIVWALLQSKP